jgi:probable HAF family extracellular repeat protein
VRRFAVALSLSLLTFTVPAQAAPMFMGLGNLSGGGFESLAHAVSGDGTVVVGMGRVGGCGGGIGCGRAFRWTSGGGMTDLGTVGGVGSYARAVSADGSVVVGESDNTSGRNEGFRWETGEMVGLGDLTGGVFDSFAWDVSADRSVVVGSGYSESGRQAFRWTAGTGMLALSGLPEGSSTEAMAVSADGLVIAGTVSGDEAFIWQGGVLTGLGDLPGGAVDSIARGISADGSTVVGASNSALGREAYRWTAPGNMVGLGDLPGGIFFSDAWDASADGSVVVGLSLTGPSQSEAFVWDQANGMRNLRDVLVSDFGLDLSGWSLTEARGLSDDGRTIVGHGTNPSGNTEAWMAVIPEPTTALLLASGLTALAVRHRRRA